MNAGLTRRSVLAACVGAGTLGAFARQPLIALRADTRADQSSQLSSGDLGAALFRFSKPSRRRLQSLISAPDFSAHIPAAEAKALAAVEKKNTESLMLALLPLAQTLARPPISNFKAAVVARGAHGDLYLGGNLEIPGEPLGFSVHAEQSAICNAYMHADEGVTAIAGSDAPCGHCRQFINELARGAQTEIIIEGSAPTSLATLLPQSFGPKDLGATGAFPVKQIALTLPTQPSASDAALAEAALAAARSSYAPYSKSPAGVAIATRTGRIFRGSYIENAAFNPSLSPLQVTLLALIGAGATPGDITRAALVEVEHSAISQRSATRTVLSAVAPAAKLLVVHAVRG
jgi:cytidine deaminase